jgi:hypothetical protein
MTLVYDGHGAWIDDSNAPVVLSENTDPGTVGLNEILDKYDVIEVDPQEGFMIVSARGERARHDGIELHETGSVRLDDNVDTLAPDQAFREMGSSSPSPWTNWLRREHNQQLRGERALETYMKMKRSSGAIRGALRLFKTPIVGARWYVEPGSTGYSKSEPKKRNVKIAKRFHQMLFEDMSRGWNEVLTEALLCADYGYYMFEKVFMEYDDGFLGWKKLAPRHPMDVQEWIYDVNGGPAAVRMRSDKSAEGIVIPISKLLVFPFDIEGGDMCGTSLLRSAYMHWYYIDTLYKIDAIQKERHGIGVPIIKLPPGFSDPDKLLADQIGRNLRTNERAHIVLPSNWEILFAKLEGQPVNALESAQHHLEQVYNSILAPFAVGGDMDDKKNSLFMKSTKYVANGVSEVINSYGFAQLSKMNYVRQPAVPKLCARRIGEWDDLRTLSFALRNLIGAGVIVPDDPLEAAMREEFDLPLADKDTARIVRSPQGGPGGMVPGNLTVDPNAPGVPGDPNNSPAVTPPNAPVPPGVPGAGAPRQSPAGGMRVGTGSSNAGVDRSGG